MDQVTKNEIKTLVNNNYGFIPDDDEIDEIDNKLKERYYYELHEFRIINHLASRSILKIIEKYKEKLKNFDQITNEKLIFKFLKIAIKAYNEANNYASICLCRVAIETGLIERVAEECAKIDGDTSKDINEKILIYMKKNKKEMLHGNLCMAEIFRIITFNDVENIFEANLGQGIGKGILNKFVHGDIFSIVKKSNHPNKDIDELDEIKWIADGEAYRIGYNFLKITAEIAEILYLK